jgi:hypothetical protein
MRRARGDVSLEWWVVTKIAMESEALGGDPPVDDAAVAAARAAAEKAMAEEVSALSSAPQPTHDSLSFLHTLGFDL